MKNKTNPNKSLITGRIKLIRKKLDITQKEFSNKLGIHIKTLSSIENNRFTPTIPFLISLKQVYNISPIWIMTGEGETFLQEKVNDMNTVELFKRAFPNVPAEPEVIDLIESMAVPIIKNAMIVKALELKSTYKSHILEYEQEKAREITG